MSGMPEGEVRAFDAVIKAGARGGALVEVPFPVKEVYGTGAQVKVRATFDGFEYRGLIAPMGGGLHILGVRKDVRAAIGKDIGESVSAPWCGIPSRERWTCRLNSWTPSTLLPTPPSDSTPSRIRIDASTPSGSRRENGRRPATVVRRSPSICSGPVGRVERGQPRSLMTRRKRVDNRGDAE